MNIWALGCIIRSPNSIAVEIMEEFEKDNIIMPDEEAFAIDDRHFEEILLRLQVHQSDRDVFEDYFRLQDKQNRGISNLRQVLISVATTTTSSIQSLITTCLKIMDRTNSKMVEKTEFIVICKVINDTCFYVGDKALPVEQVYDLVNSVYTSCGKIDGQIYYPDVIEYVSQHPIVQLFISKQYQGSVASKLLTDEQIDQVAATER